MSSAGPWRPLTISTATASPSWPSEPSATDDGNEGRGAVYVLFLNGPDLTLRAGPTSPFPVPAEGGTFSFEITLSNPTEFAKTVDLWTVAVNDSVSFEYQFGPVEQRFLEAFESRTFVREQRVPAHIEPGTYTINVLAGGFPFDVQASASFFAEKADSVAARVAGGSSERVTDWGGTWTEILPDGTAIPVAEQESVPETENVRVAASRSASAVQVAPNPFAGRTALSFALDTSAEVRLGRLRSARGARVALLARGQMAAGAHTGIVRRTQPPVRTLRLPPGGWESVRDRPNDTRKVTGLTLRAGRWWDRSHHVPGAAQFGAAPGFFWVRSCTPRGG